MNAVEIADAVAELAAAPYDPDEFPFAFLEAFGNKPTTVKRLRRGTSNNTDVPGAVLQRNNVHLRALPPGTGPDGVRAALRELAAGPATAKQKAKFALATDGATVEAEQLADGDRLCCDYAELAERFGFFLPLAGITAVREVRENAFDIKATGRLNKLYVELLKENPAWGTEAKREALNHFMARLIFCYFAEDTGIFRGDDLFTETVRQMAAPDGSDAHAVLAELFRAMNVPPEDRDAERVKPWAAGFPHVNGGLFGDVGEDPADEVPRFSKIARSYLLAIGDLDWTKVNPDIFGSMIQAVADDEERGALGMHYTSVPNILKVLDPLFLDQLREQLDRAGDGSDVGSRRKLLNLRRRLARIRVFDPACGSGNFLVIAYKRLRAIEAEVNARRGETGRKSDIPLTNFRGIELRHFAAEVARLALVIAEYQCDVRHLGKQQALLHFLPLERENWITRGNALRLDWLKICPPTGTASKTVGDDLFSTPLDQPEMDFENAGGETYICGNPPYAGHQQRTAEQREDMSNVFDSVGIPPGDLDYVLCWVELWRRYSRRTASRGAFVMTNSTCQGRQVPRYWTAFFEDECRIAFARTSFRWQNNASNNAAVICVIVGMDREAQAGAFLYEDDLVSRAASITPYLTRGEPIFVAPRTTGPLSPQLTHMRTGNMPIDGGHYVLQPSEVRRLTSAYPEASAFVRPFLGSKEISQGLMRYCLWIKDEEKQSAAEILPIAERVEACRAFRDRSKRKATQKLAATPHRFAETQDSRDHVVALQNVSSERKSLRTPVLLPNRYMVSNLCFGLYDGNLWELAIISSAVHHCWIATVCGKLKTDYRYSNTLGWNTFPVPPLTDAHRAELTTRAEDILLAREAHWPATIAELYDPDEMPDDLRAAHDRNDETLERIYIGRRFKNDTERLEHLFARYAEMTAEQ